MNKQIPTIDLTSCEFKNKVLYLASEFIGMPKEFNVRSQFTNKVVRFRTISEDHPLFDYDGWDGEQQIYEPVEKLKNVTHLVISHQY